MWQQYRKTAVQDARPYVAGEDMTGISVGPEDVAKGSPKVGDMIARRSDNHDDQWLIEQDVFSKTYVPA